MSTSSDDERTEKAETRTDWAEDRTIMANERTFASWIGAGMGALAIAIGLQAVFGPFEPTWLAKLVASLFLFVAIVLFWSARNKAKMTYDRLTEHDTEARKTRDFTGVAILLTTGTTGIGIVLWLI